MVALKTQLKEDLVHLMTFISLGKISTKCIKSKSWIMADLDSKILNTCYFLFLYIQTIYVLEIVVLEEREKEGLGTLSWAHINILIQDHQMD